MVRLSAMGDVIHGLPAIAALRAGTAEPARSAGWSKNAGPSCCVHTLWSVCSRALN